MFLNTSPDVPPSPNNLNDSNPSINGTQLAQVPTPSQDRDPSLSLRLSTAVSQVFTDFFSGSSNQSTCSFWQTESNPPQIESEPPTDILSLNSGEDSSQDDITQSSAVSLQPLNRGQEGEFAVDSVPSLEKNESDTSTGIDIDRPGWVKLDEKSNLNSNQVSIPSSPVDLASSCLSQLVDSTAVPAINITTGESNVFSHDKHLSYSPTSSISQHPAGYGRCLPIPSSYSTPSLSQSLTSSHQSSPSERMIPKIFLLQKLGFLNSKEFFKNLKLLKQAPSIKHLSFPYFTITILMINTIMVVWSIFLQGGFESFNVNPMLGPSAYVMVSMGAKWHPLLIFLSQWWRLFSAIHLHAGLIHFTFNMLSLWHISYVLEQQHGFFRVMMIYLLSGLGGNILSSIFLPETITVGASGSIYGFFAILLVDLFKNWKKLPSPWRSLICLSVVIITSFLMGFLPQLDNYAHIGGFVIGILSGIIFLPSLHLGEWKFKERVIQVFVALPILLLLFVCSIAILVHVNIEQTSS